MTAANPRTNVRVEIDALNSMNGLDTIRRTLMFLDEMRQQGWIVELNGHLGADLRRPAPLAKPQEAKSA